MAQKQANDALVKGIVAQQQQIQKDAATLQQLQSQASTADGQMKALMAANQLAALQQEQLLQIRELLLQEQQALVARGQTLANDDAMSEAATEKFFNVPPITLNHTGLVSMRLVRLFSHSVRSDSSRVQSSAAASSLQ